MDGSNDPTSGISVIIVTYNSRSQIDACLLSISRYSPDVEVVVVDNMSTDGTLEHVRKHYPQILAISSGRNAGFGAGVNVGVAAARGTYLAILNPDTVVEAGWLEPLLDALNDLPHAGMVTATLLLLGTDSKVNACGNDVHLTGLTFCARLNEPAPPITAQPRSVAAISGAAFALRRSTWNSLGGFDERFFMYLEDTDLSLRVRRLGLTIYHIPASRVWHSYSTQVSASKLSHLECNRLLMLYKNLSLITLIFLLPSLLLTEIVVWAFCARNGIGYLSAKLRAYRQAWSLCRQTQTIKMMGAISSEQTDRGLLTIFTPRLSLNQLEHNAVESAANVALTALFALWQVIVLAIIC